MDIAKQIGPVEECLRNSDRAELRALCSLSNLELIEYMDNYLDTPVERYDHAVFDAANQLLDERAPIDVQIDVEATLEQFKREHADLFPSMRKGAENVSTHRKRPVGRWIRRCIAAAIAISTLGAVVAYAFNPEVFQPVLDLGDRVVRFISWGRSGELELPNNTSTYTSLREALDMTGAEDAQAPTWIPQDLCLSDIRVVTVEENIDESSYWAMFNGEERDLLFHVESIVVDAEGYVDEKDEDGDATFIRGETTYNLTTNMGREQIKWENGNYKYSMVGEMTEEEYLHIIDSLK